MNWKKTIGALAPVLGTALGGPLAGLATRKICDIFGLDSATDNIEGQLQCAVQNMTSAQAIELRKGDNDFDIEMKKLDVDIMNLRHLEKASARDMYSREGLENKIPQMALGLIILIGTFSCFWMVLSGKVHPGADQLMVGTIIGCLISEMKQVTGFYLGAALDAIKTTFKEK